VLAWSRLATDLLGLRGDEVQGEHLLNLDVGLPFSELREPLRRVLADEEPEEVTIEGHDRRGHAVHYLVRFAPLRLADAIDGVTILVSAQRSD